MISVIMATYNGSKYIREQLDSILNQTYRINEIIICDDSSKDDTLTILNSYDELDHVRILRNPCNLGVVKTFARCLEFVNGDYVFFADQDDIWDYHKVEIMISTMRPNSNLYFSNAKFLKSDNKQELLFDYLNLHKLARYNFLWGHSQVNLFRRGNIVVGATMLVRAEFLLKNYRTDIKILHDYYLGLLAAGENSLQFTTKPLIQYRIHSEQTAGIDNKKNLFTRARKIHETLDNQTKVVERTLQSQGLDKSVRIFYLEMLDFIGFRKAQLSRNLFISLSFLSFRRFKQYVQYANLRHIILDLLLCA